MPVGDKIAISKLDLQKIQNVLFGLDCGLHAAKGSCVQLKWHKKFVGGWWFLEMRGDEQVEGKR